MNESKIQSSLDEIKKALQSDVIENAGITTASGGYGLDMAGAAILERCNTPFIDDIVPSQAGGTGLAVSYWSINGSTGKMTGSFGATGEGQRGGVMGYKGTLGGATYKTIAVDGVETDESLLVTEGNFDPHALAIQASLKETKRFLEKTALFGRTTTASDAYAPGGIGSASAPTIVAGSAGSITAGTYSFKVVPLNGYAFYNTRSYSVNGNWGTGAGAELLNSTRTNGDSTTAAVASGTGIISSATSTGAVAGSSNSFTVSVSPVSGALGYAWFAGAAGSEVYQGTTGIATAVFTSLSTGTQAAGSNFASDNSADALVFDGLITRMQAPGSGARILTMPNGSSFTPTTDGSLAEFNTLFAGWAQDLDGYSPEYILVSPKGKFAISKALTDNSVKASKILYMRGVNTDLDMQMDFVSVRNSLTGTSLPVIVDPYLPDGVILIGTKSIGSSYAGSISNPIFLRTRQNYKAEVWPRRTRQWENTVSWNGALATPWLPGFGAILNAPF